MSFTAAASQTQRPRQVGRVTTGGDRTAAWVGWGRGGVLLAGMSTVSGKFCFEVHQVYLMGCRRTDAVDYVIKYVQRHIRCIWLQRVALSARIPTHSEVTVYPTHSLFTRHLL